MKKTFKKKRKATTEVKSLSLHLVKDKTIVSFAYKHTTHIQIANPKGNTNSFKDVTNYTLLDRVRVPRLVPELATAARNVVEVSAFLDAKDISKYYRQIDWRQASALKAWRTRRGHADTVIIVK